MGFSPEVQEILDRVKSGAPKPKRVAQPKRMAGPRPKPPVFKPVYDRAHIVALYKQGKSVAEITEILGAHRATVSRVLTAMGVPPEERKGGPVRKPMCAKGLHSMADAYEIKGGGRACRHCKKERARRS